MHPKLYSECDRHRNEQIRFTDMCLPAFGNYMLYVGCCG